MGTADYRTFTAAHVECFAVVMITGFAVLAVHDPAGNPVRIVVSR